MTEAPAPDVLFFRLNSGRYTARQLALAAGVSEDVLTNYLSKQKLRLASLSAGQGRSREFCLIDVYQVALLAAFTTLTGNTARCAATLGTLLTGPAWEVIDQARVADDVAKGRAEASSLDQETANQVISSYLYKVSLDAREAQVAYAWRDLSRPFYLFLLPPDRADPVQDYVHYVTNDLSKTIPKLTAALFVNATRYLAEVDARLIAVVDRDAASRTKPTRKRKAAK